MVKGVLKTLLKMNNSAPTKITRNLQKKYDSKYMPATLEQIKKLCTYSGFTIISWVARYDKIESVHMIKNNLFQKAC